MERKIQFIKFFFLTLCLTLSFFYTLVEAEDLTSASFIIRDPIIGTGGGFGSSTNFQLISAGNTLLSGVGSSTSFLGHYGFLYYPYVTVPVLSVSPSGVNADLTWTAATAGQGWTVAGYNTGISTTPGGPYTFTDVGNVLLHTYLSLAPDDYCFVVQVYDAFDYVIDTSNEDCVTINTGITFDIDTEAGGGNGESNAPYSVGLGVVSTADTRVSGTTDGVQMIVLEGEVTSAGGMVVTVRNTNGSNGLVSASVSGDNINSVDGTMADGTENYGLCVATAGLASFVRATPYDSGACAVDSETNAIQGLTSVGEPIIDSGGGAITGGHAQVIVNAAISTVTPAHTDYEDTLTFIATGEF